MTLDNSSISFSTVLASTVHDMKNSLGMLLNAINYLNDKYPLTQEQDQHQFSLIQYEASRLNAMLVQLLGLYKHDHDQLLINNSYQQLDDFLGDLVLQHQPLTQSKGIVIELEVDEDIDAIFDPQLVSNIINNILGNTIRYSKKKILISAKLEDYLIIEIADDGNGYPKNMIESCNNLASGIDFTTGSTGLGLYFSTIIAELHKKQDKQGFVKIFNGDPLGGGVFQLFLP